jgi:carbon storage regulator
MLVLTRKPGEEVVIGDNIRVTVVSICGNRVRLGFTAPAETLIHRAELRSFSEAVSRSDRSAVQPAGAPAPSG